MASFWGELKRRNVFRVGIAYSAAVWLLLQVADLVLSNLGAPPWIIQALIVSAAIGLPVVLVLAWVFDITPDGIVVTAGAGTEQAPRFSERSINFLIIGLLVLAVGFLVANNYLSISTQRDRSIAVLPFVNLSNSDSESAEFFSTGMHDLLLTQLSKLGDLRVISRTSVSQYADTSKDIRQIGQELDVATIMESTVLRSGDHLQINVQLIDAATDEHIWADVYDRELTAANIFAVQREMATSIAGQLRAALTPSEKIELDQVPTENTRALEFFLTGNDYAGRPDERVSMPIAIRAYEQAVEEDPTFALAWAKLAHARTEDYAWGQDHSAEQAARAQQALRTARDLAPDLPEVHAAAAMYERYVNIDPEAAIAEAEIALRGFPGSADVLNTLASLYRRAGRFDESIAFRLRALELDPRNVDSLLSLAGGTYARMRNYAAAERTLDRALEIAPDNSISHWAKAMIPLWRDGDTDALRELVGNPPIPLGRYRAQAGWDAAIYDRDYPTALRYLDSIESGTRSRRFIAVRYAQTHLLAGDRDAARPYLEELQALSQARLARDPDSLRDVIDSGFARAGLGDTDAGITAARQAMDILARSRDPDDVENRREDLLVLILGPAGEVDLAVKVLDDLLSGQCLYSIESFSRDPRLEPLLGEMRFEELVERYRRAPG